MEKLGSSGFSGSEVTENFSKYSPQDSNSPLEKIKEQLQKIHHWDASNGFPSDGKIIISSGKKDYYWFSPTQSVDCALEIVNIGEQGQELDFYASRAPLSGFEILGKLATFNFMSITNSNQTLQVTRNNNSLKEAGFHSNHCYIYIGNP